MPPGRIAEWTYSGPVRPIVALIRDRNRLPVCSGAPWFDGIRASSISIVCNLRSSAVKKSLFPKGRVDCGIGNGVQLRFRLALRACRRPTFHSRLKSRQKRFSRQRRPVAASVNEWRLGVCNAARAGYGCKGNRLRDATAKPDSCRSAVVRRTRISCVARVSAAHPGQCGDRFLSPDVRCALMRATPVCSIREESGRRRRPTQPRVR